MNCWEAYVEETGAVFGPPIAPREEGKQLLPDQLGGDHIDDQKIWMNLGVGKRFVESEQRSKKTAL